MLDTIYRFTNQISAQLTRQNVYIPMAALADALSSQLTTSGALAITGVASSTAKIVNAITAVCAGRSVTKAAATNMPALAGTVPNAQFNVFSFFIDNAGVLSTLAGTPATSLVGVIHPQRPQFKAQIGYVIVNPTGTGAFVGGTTALDDATVVPNAVYVNTVGAFDPTVLVL